MPTKKIADLPTLRGCRSPQHQPPAHESLPPGVYEHTCPSCGHQVRFRVDPPIGLAEPDAFRATGVTLRADSTTVCATLPGEREGADQQRARRLLREVFQTRPTRNWLPPVSAMSPEAKEHVQGALNALKARKGEPAEDWAKWLAPFAAADGRTSPSGQGGPIPLSQMFLDDATLFETTEGWMNPRSAVKAIEAIVRQLHDPDITCDEAKELLRRRIEIINAWCAATGADEVPGGPFEHDLRGINPHTGEPALVWVINGDILDTTPLEGPAVAAWEWVRRFGTKEAL